MIILSEVEIMALIREGKPIPEKLCPIRNMTDRHQHRRKNFDITGESGSEFVIKVRQSTLNILDFSVILGYKMPGLFRVFRLRRYNGKSHRHTNTLEKETFYSFHFHSATERYQKAGFKEDHFAQTTKRYGDLNSAIQCLLSDCGFRSPVEEGPLFTGKI